MYKVSKDVIKNRLHIELEGLIGIDEAIQASSAVIDAARTMKRGFDLVNDIREFRPTSEACVAELMRTQAFLVSLGMRHVVRVSASAVARMQLDRAGKAVGYEAMTVTTLEEANRILDGNL
jgi:prolyl oligopeptidase PreP (S9A serine peptidase family)